MNRLLFIFISLSLLLLSNHIIVSAQISREEARVEFEHFSLKEGLSQNRTHFTQRGGSLAWEAAH